MLPSLAHYDTLTADTLCVSVNAYSEFVQGHHNLFRVIRLSAGYHKVLGTAPESDLICVWRSAVGV